MRTLLKLFFLTLLSLPLNGQKLFFKVDGEDTTKLNIKDKREFSKQIKKDLDHWIEEGFLLAHSDTLVNSKDSLILALKKGEQYSWSTISAGNIHPEAISYSGFRENNFNSKKISPKEIVKLKQKIIEWYEQNGYPFAETKMDSITINNNLISTILNADKGPYYQWDSVVFKSASKLPEEYILHYLDIQKGKPYNEKILQSIDQRLRNLNFLELKKSSEVLFTESKCILYLFLEKKKVSQFNGILGILPNEITGKIVITGDVRLRLKNSFNRAELIDLNWRKINEASQDLKLNGNFPSILKSAFGADLLFKLFKRDSTYLELTRQISPQYILPGGSIINLSFNLYTSDLITPSQFASASTLPPFADVTRNLFGAGGFYERFDNPQNPLKGFSFQINASAGKKIIRKNPKVNQELYNEINLSSSQYQASGTGIFHLPLFKRTSLRLAEQFGWIENERIFFNELYRIGGLKTLRGFDEESISASSYSITTIEWRYLLERNSSAFIFTDLAWYERSVSNEYTRDLPLGFGAGFFFGTKAGIFSLSYALGKQFNNPVLIRNGKIHFGFLSTF